MKRLTEKQKYLITEYLSDNYKRAIQCIHIVMRRKLAAHEIEDYIGIVHEALVKAAMGFRDDKGMKFSSFANMTIQSSLKSELTKENRLSRLINKLSVSFDMPVNNESELYLKDVIPGETDISIQEYTKIEQYFATLPDKAKKALLLRLKGYDWLDVEHELSCTSTEIKEIISTLQKYERVKLLQRD